MRKFPVISESGREYEVRIVTDIVTFDYIEVEIYAREYEEIRGFFAKGTRPVARFLSKEYIPDRKFERDYVEAAKRAVARYEESVESRNRWEAKEAEQERKFNEWDGRC